MTTRVSSNTVVRHNKIPFNLLVENDDFEDGKHNRADDTPKFRHIVDKFVGNLSLKKQRRYPYATTTDNTQYKHTRLNTVCDVEERHNPDDIVLDDEDLPLERSTSLDELCSSSEIARFDSRKDFPPPSAFMGRRRSRSESDLITTEIFARRTRRAAICEEMERGIMMDNGITLRKCRKNLVLNQILENLSLL